VRSDDAASHRVKMVRHNHRHRRPQPQRDIKLKHSDGREDKYTFVRHVERSEGIVIMGPSEHN
jgi:hypothetical protein